MCQVVSGEISKQTNSKPIAFIHHSLDWYRCLPQGKLSQTNQLSQMTAARMGALYVVRDKLISISLPEILSHIICIPVIFLVIYYYNVMQVVLFLKYLYQLLLHHTYFYHHVPLSLVFWWAPSHTDAAGRGPKCHQ